MHCRTCPRKPGGACANLSVQADHADHSVRARRLERSGRPRARQEAVARRGGSRSWSKTAAAAAADRHRCRRHGGAGWLHAAAGVADLHHQPGGQEDHAVRSGQGFHAGRLYWPRAAAGHDIEQAAGRNPPASCSLSRRSKPGQITYASAGLGSINQISTELIALSAGVKFLHVPYKGGAPALNDLVGGHVDIFVSSLPQALQLVRSGQIKTLAVTSSRRTALLPDVPTLAEAGNGR